MKSLQRSIGIAIATFSLLAVARAEDPEKSVDKEIRSVLQAQEEAWNRGDIDEFMKGYAHSDGTSFVSEDKVTYGWDTVRKRYHKSYPDRSKMGKLTFLDLGITPLGNDAALAVGSWRLDNVAGTPHGRFTLLFRLTNNGWRIVYDHTSAAAK